MLGDEGFVPRDDGAAVHDDGAAEGDGCVPRGDDDSAKPRSGPGSIGHRDDAHVRVRVTRSGGVAGITRKWDASPPPGEESEWVTAIEDCPWNEEPEARAGANRSDGFVWHIVAIIPHDEMSTTLPEAAVTGPWKALIQFVREASQ